jgi:hypothetical protein
MTINVHALLADALTIATGVKAACGALVAKLWSKFLGTEKKLRADLAAATAKAEADAKKVVAAVEADVKKL